MCLGYCTNCCGLYHTHAESRTTIHASPKQGGAATGSLVKNRWVDRSYLPAVYNVPDDDDTPTIPIVGELRAITTPIFISDLSSLGVGKSVTDNPLFTEDPDLW